MTAPAEKRQRLIEAAAAVLEGASNRRLSITVLNKALFYLDLMALRDSGQTITRNPYIALEAGPVVAQYSKRLIRQLEVRSLAHQETSPTQSSKPVVLDQSPHEFLYLIPADRKLAFMQGQRVSKFKPTEISKLSHENPGWQYARSLSIAVGRPQPIDMLLAMQEVIERDPWLDIPLEGDTVEAMDDPDFSQDLPWD